MSASVVKTRLTGLTARLGRLGSAFCVLLLIYILLRLLAPSPFLLGLTTVALIVLGAWLAIRGIRRGIRAAIWRLRNRLLVTYAFIAVVPVLLIFTLAALGAYVLASQVAVYLTTSALDRDIVSMQTAADALLRTGSRDRNEALRRTGELYANRFPGLALLVQQNGSLLRWPPESEIEPPAPAWGNISGIALHNGRYYAWAHAVADNGMVVTASVPLTRRFLSGMVPGLGEVYFLRLAQRRNGQQNIDWQPVERESAVNALPPAANRFDVPFGWLSSVSIASWSEAGAKNFGLLMVRTRVSALTNILFSRGTDELQGVLPVVLLVVAIAFLIVELVALFIGVSLTRTVTRAVHSLYEGTIRVMRGDFSHRIKVSGNDQLASLGHSFNSMTENLERLVVVAKEKERLQAEIEIAKQVQEQLYPKTVPSVRTLRVGGLCQPARMVSGDYYDFQRIHDSKLAIAIGDVAGKGISAALLMASIQSAMRMELRSSVQLAAPSHQPVNGARLSTARMVSELNEQLYATTAPEKYATFFFGLYDDISGILSYTNAGHLPPLCFHNGEPKRLEVNGTVVGAFPRSRYEEGKLQLAAGDLLVCYTDGITEPENEYGEMFGEERLCDLVAKNLDRDESRIMEIVIDAVRQWTASPELQDDMTLLLARKQ